MKRLVFAFAASMVLASHAYAGDALPKPASDQTACHVQVTMYA